MGALKTILSESYILFRSTNKLVRPVIQPITRLYATDDKHNKKEKKLAKKLASLAAEPQCIQDRLNKWTKLKQKYDQEVAAKEKEIIKVTLLDGKIVEGFGWDLTPLDVAKGISSGLAAEVYLAKVNDVLWDVERPLEVDCEIQLMKFDSPDAKAAFWTTAGFTVAEALERLYVDNGGLVCHVGSTQTGFYVDLQLKDKTINRKDIAAIEEGISKILSGLRSKVDRIVASKHDANELFAQNPFKLKAISDSAGDTITIYRCGCFTEITDTPLIRHNKKVYAVKILRMESVLRNGEPIQRIHGIAFPSMKELKEFLKHNE